MNGRRSDHAATLLLDAHASLLNTGLVLLRRYTGFWFLRVSALTAEESASAAWLRAVISTNTQVSEAVTVGN